MMKEVNFFIKVVQRYYKCRVCSKCLVIYQLEEHSNECKSKDIDQTEQFEEISKSIYEKALKEKNVVPDAIEIEKEKIQKEKERRKEEAIKIEKEKKREKDEIEKMFQSAEECDKLNEKWGKRKCCSII